MSLIRRMRSPEPETDPATRSLCPFMYFVALSITRSNPSSAGRQSTGLAKVLSIIEIKPFARANATTASRSAIWTSGLVRVST